MQPVRRASVVHIGPFRTQPDDIEKNNSFSWGDMPDTDFIDEVYVKAWSFRLKVQGYFKSHEGKTDKGTPIEEGIPETVDNGLFSGVAAQVR